VVELYPKAAPKTVENFLGYANSHYYDGLLFHRVIDNFMIQAGGYWYDHSPKEPTQGSVVNESNNGLKNLKGTIAMARVADPDSAKAQFFINLQDNSHLNAKQDQPGYTVFGKVIAGQDVADAIGKVPVEYLSSRFANIPKTPVQILSIKLKETQ
jgi:peptidyl-prolyl cis-trans isomerase A (cyclophilin A)